MKAGIVFLFLVFNSCFSMQQERKSREKEPCVCLGEKCYMLHDTLNNRWFKCCNCCNKKRLISKEEYAKSLLSPTYVCVCCQQNDFDVLDLAFINNPSCDCGEKLHSKDCIFRKTIFLPVTGVSYYKEDIIEDTEKPISIAPKRKRKKNENAGKKDVKSIVIVPEADVSEEEKKTDSVCLAFLKKFCFCK